MFPRIFFRGSIRIGKKGKQAQTGRKSIFTSFHDYSAEDDFVVYLGGFHNKVKRDFLLYLYQWNPEKEYRHFGDIDAGGFYILEHLKKETGIPFRSLYYGYENTSEISRGQKTID